VRRGDEAERRAVLYRERLPIKGVCKQNVISEHVFEKEARSVAIQTTENGEP
jgi:hypothetical protein